MYDPAKYSVGEKVRVVDLQKLKAFLEVWKLHHPLKPDQLEYAGKPTFVTASSMYHGGDMLYELQGAPGFWHERCLEPLE